MKKLILLILTLLSVTVYGQQPNNTNTKFTNGLAVPDGATEKPTTGLTPGALFYKTATGLRVWNGSAWVTLGTGAGTVTSFSSGNLSPLFTTSVATATTTPALTFALSNAGANTVFGNNTGSSAAPSFFSYSTLTGGYGISSAGTYNVATSRTFSVDSTEVANKTWVNGRLGSFVTTNTNQTSGLTGNKTWSGTHTFSSSILTTASSSILTSSFAGTGGNYITLSNASGQSFVGIDNSAGTIFGNGNYSFNLSHAANAPMNFWTNNMLRSEISAAGLMRWYAYTTAGGILRTDGSGNITGTTSLPDGTTATTQAPNDNSTKLATTAYVDASSAAGVTSIAGTANQITASAATGAVTLSLPSTLIAPGTVTSTSTFTLLATPTTSSSGAFDMLTRNTSTGAAEKATVTGTGTVVALQDAPTFTGTVTIAGGSNPQLAITRTSSGAFANPLTVQNSSNASGTATGISLSASTTTATGLIYSQKTNGSAPGSGGTADLKFQTLNNTLTDVGSFTSAGLFSSTGGISSTTGAFTTDVTAATSSGLLTTGSSALNPDQTPNAGSIVVKTASSATADRKGGINLVATDARAANIGVPVQWNTDWNDANNTAYGIASITGRREGNTDAQPAGYLSFATSNTSGTLAEQMRLSATGVLSLNTAPATSAGSYDALTRNSSTGAVEKISIASDTYTPTVTGVANISSVTATDTRWMRIGNVVTVSGLVIVAPTAGSATTSFRVSLPVASNLAAYDDLTGPVSWTSLDINGGQVTADFTNDEALVSISLGASGASFNAVFEFKYT